MPLGPVKITGKYQGRRPVDWDDEYNEEYNDAMPYDDVGYNPHREKSMPDKSSSEGEFDPMAIANPVSAYFSLSDDA